MMWVPTPEWAGETAFIMGGGSSVAEQPVELLKGRRLIVINSSYQRAPWADFLLWCDSRWWFARCDEVSRMFKGRIVTSWPSEDSRLLVMKRANPPLTRDPAILPMRHTSTTSAIQLAVHLGAKRIVLLGIDQGGSHHHVPHPWPLKPNAYHHQSEELAGIAPQLSAWGIDVVNASPTSTLTCWPRQPFEETL